MRLLFEPRQPRTDYLLVGGEVPLAWKKHIEV
jgi:hypothetical protein